MIDAKGAFEVLAGIQNKMSTYQILRSIFEFRKRNIDRVTKSLVEWRYNTDCRRRFYENFRNKIC